MQLDTDSVGGAGTVTVEDIHSKAGARLLDVIPTGGVTINLSADAVLTAGASLGATDLSVTGAFALDVSAITTTGPDNWGIRAGTDTITVSDVSSLRLAAEQANTQGIDGAGDVSVAAFVDGNTVDVSGIVVSGDVSLERGGSSADAETYTVTLASGDVSYLLDGNVSYSLEGAVRVGDSTEGDFILEVTTPTSGQAAVSITGFASGADADATNGKDADTYDVLDFSSIASVTEAGELVVSKATAVSPDLFDGAGLVVFRSGSAETADTIEAAFAVNTNNNDFVGAGSVNDLLSAGESMLFAIRAFDTDGETEITNFWLWQDGTGSQANDGNVQSEELTKIVELYDFAITSLSGENTILFAEPGPV
jgi:hypothetical protein